MVGPTATGKSDLAIALAHELGAEIINADSMQLYQGMDIGTAKIPPAERQGIPHHLLDVWDVDVTATAAAYQTLCRDTLANLHERNTPAIVVGGSGLYIRAALDQIEFPGTDPELRATLESELDANGPEALHQRLADLDPAAAERMQPTNGRRIVRALEVVLMTGSMPGALTDYPMHIQTTYVGLDREDLADRVAQRVDRMWQQGLVEEVRNLPPLGITAARALGYAQALAQLAGDLNEQQAKEQTVIATRRFVKRQRAWFRRDPRVKWLDAGTDAAGRALRLVTHD